VKQYYQLCLISAVNLVSHLSKNTTDRKVIELFLALHFPVKHGGSVSATARQQTYCASNLEKGGVQVPAR